MSVLTKPAALVARYFGLALHASFALALILYAGFLVAARVPVWASVMIVLVLELIPLAFIRDNLTLNVWMLLSPDPSIRSWQAGA